MDKGNDVLVVYLTSYGGRDFKLTASHWPLDVEPLTPQLLSAALDKAGIRNRVIVGLLFRRLNCPVGQRKHTGDDRRRRHPHLLGLWPFVGADLLWPYDV